MEQHWLCSCLAFALHCNVNLLSSFVFELNTGHKRCCIGQWNIFKLSGGIVSRKKVLRLFFSPSRPFSFVPRSQMLVMRQMYCFRCYCFCIVKPILLWYADGLFTLHTICVVHLLSVYLSLRQNHIVDFNVRAFFCDARPLDLNAFSILNHNCSSSV